MQQKQIEIIKNYLAQNGVEYYDVQAELIDHFATAVERQQAQNPALGFKEALHKAHRDFGGKEGFRKFLEEAESSVRSKTYRMVGQTLLRFLSWPYLVLTLAITAGWFMVFTQVELRANYIFLSINTLFLAVIIYNYYRLRNVQMFLPRRTTNALGWVLYLVIYIPGNHIWLTGDVFSKEFGVGYFTLLTLTLISFYKIPGLAIAETKKLYPAIN